MEIPEFDIYWNKNDKGPSWVESVRDLAIAKREMVRLAAAAPGKYCVFSTKTNEVVAEIDSSIRMLRVVPPKSKAGAA